MTSAQVSSRKNPAFNTDHSDASVPEVVLYAAPFSSASPVQSALLELNVPHQTIKFDFAEKKHLQAEFLALNPNGKVPTLLVDGVPMFEALAILVYLGERFGVERGMWPAANTADRRTAQAWATWSYVTYGTQITLLLHATSDRFPAELRNPAQAKLAKERLDGLLDILETRLGLQKFMLGDGYSLLDLIVASVVGYGATVGASVDRHPRVQKWLAAFQARPVYAAGISLAA